MIVSAAKVNRLLLVNRPYYTSKYITVSEDYETISLDILNNRILPGYYNWLSQMNLLKYNKKWNCVNYSESLRLFAKIYHNNTESKASSIALGIVYYTSKSRQEDSKEGPHTINVAITTEESPRLKLTFIEPQTCEIITLTEEEYNSIKILYI